MSTFSFVGTIHPMKNEDHGFTVQKYDSGWMNERFKFIVACGNNTHIVEINAGKWQDDSKNMIYTMSKSDGNNKSEKIQIDWNKRNDPDVIDTVAGWKRMKVDLDTKKNRTEIENSGDKEAIAKSNKKNREFIAPTDFCEFVHKLVCSDKIKDKKFRVNGNVVYTYSNKDDRFYSNYEVNKMYLVEDDKDFESGMTIDFYFNKDSFNYDDITETGKALASGYTIYYNNMEHKNMFCPVDLVLHGDEKTAKFWNKRVFDTFTGDTEVRFVRLDCECINGSDEKEITLEDLDPDTQEDIEFGLTTLEDVIRDMRNGKIKGDKIQEIRINKFGRGSSKGSEDTTYTNDLLTEKPGSNNSSVSKNNDGVEVEIDDDDDDFFDDL